MKKIENKPKLINGLTEMININIIATIVIFNNTIF